MSQIEGIVPIVPVPFHNDGRIDEESLRQVVDFCVRERAAAVCLPAYGSEFYKLSENERLRVVDIAVQQSAGRVPVIGQANHPSVAVAIDLARAMESCGADVISMAAPRVFAPAEDDLLRYFQTVCKSIRGELLIQDFNPGGPTVGASFAGKLRAACPNFRYLKLEDPFMAPRIRAIHEATGGQVGVLEGWGGMYTLELMAAGICGVMPGTATLTPLNRVFWSLKRGNPDAAYEAFQAVLPLIVFELQHMELFLHVEKRILKKLGVIKSAHVRETTIQLDPDTDRHAEWLIERLLPLLRS
ncbi:MAG: dihydrodipicolinate synthase family protein [Actinomycetota bacterium]